MFSFDEIGLFVAAVIPAIVLMIYTYRKDRTDKEPVGTLVLFFVSGVFSCIPASIIEDIFDKFYSSFFSVNTEIFQLHETFGANDYLYYFFFDFLGVALAEEGVKWIILHLFASKNKHFDSLFDGIIYAVVISLGFATLENILYVMNDGWETAILRMFLSVPGHFFYGVLMGYNYSWGHLYNTAGKLEKSFKLRGFIPADSSEYSGKKYIIMSLLIPLIIHGAYDFCLDIKHAIISILITLVCYFICFKRVRKLSKSDSKHSSAVDWLMYNKYPYLWSTYNTAYYPNGTYNNQYESFDNQYYGQ